MKSKVKQGQSFLDKVLQLTGSIETALDVSMATGIGITDDLPIDTLIETDLVKNRRIVEMFNKEDNTEPATAIKNYTDDFTPVAIGWSAIGINFRIS